MKVNAKKHDTGKLKYDLIEPEMIEVLAQVLTYGADKYGEGNWKGLNSFESRYSSAMMRHYEAWRKGEEIDGESGLSHLGHAACNILFLYYNSKKN